MSTIGLQKILVPNFRYKVIKENVYIIIIILSILFYWTKEMFKSAKIDHHMYTTEGNIKKKM